MRIRWSRCPRWRRSIDPRSCILARPSRTVTAHSSPAMLPYSIRTWSPTARSASSIDTTGESSEALLRRLCSRIRRSMSSRRDSSGGIDAPLAGRLTCALRHRPQLGEHRRKLRVVGRVGARQQRDHAPRRLDPSEQITRAPIRDRDSCSQLGQCLAMRGRVGPQFQRSEGRLVVPQRAQTTRDGCGGPLEVALGLLEQTLSRDGLRPCPRRVAAREHRRPSPAHAAPAAKSPNWSATRPAITYALVASVVQSACASASATSSARAASATVGSTNRSAWTSTSRASGRQGRRSWAPNRSSARRAASRAPTTSPAARRVRAASNAVSATSVTLPPASIAASAVSASRRASSTRFAESRTDARSARVTASCWTISELWQTAARRSPAPRAQPGRCPRGRTGSRGSAPRSRRGAHARWHRRT